MLKENNILSDELYSSARIMAKFRNIVVHHYDKVNADIDIAIYSKTESDPFACPRT